MIVSSLLSDLNNTKLPHLKYWVVLPIFETSEARVFKLVSRLIISSTGLKMTNHPQRGRGHGNMAHLIIWGPYSIFRTDEVR